MDGIVCEVLWLLPVSQKEEVDTRVRVLTAKASSAGSPVFAVSRGAGQR